MANKPIVIVQGAQWGSEAKGSIAAKLCLDRNIEFAVRTGAINAGHSVVYKGEKYAMQQLPVGWVNPSTQLVIGAGAYIHPDTLWREIDMVNRAMPELDVRNRLFIDYRCGIHTTEDEVTSKMANRHHKMGATGKGCSEAIVSKIRNRNDGYSLFRESAAGKAFVARNEAATFCDTAYMLNRAVNKQQQILLEGTQGTFLDLHLGPYPFTTSRMTSAANWIAEAGLSPTLSYEVVLVVRTYPIRVAGNSGPMNNEIEWRRLANTINARLHSKGLPPRVDPNALFEFEECMMQAAIAAGRDGRYTIPTLNNTNIYNIDLSTWNPYEREMFRVAASELHRDAFALMSDRGMAELRKLFEMTTVTKKLRRVANMHMGDLEMSCMLNRPSWIALTFMDYIYPEYAGSTEADMSLLDADEGMGNYLFNFSEHLGVDVRMVSFGPAPENVLEMKAAAV